MADWNPWVEDDEEPEPDASMPAGVLQLLEAQASLLVSIATGGRRIQMADAEYKRRRTQLNGGLRALGLEPPLPFADLWAWHGRWTRDMPTYADRRSHIAELVGPTRDALETMAVGRQVSDVGSSGNETWAALDARVDGIVAELARATSRDDHQDVGRRCREVLIDAAKLLADPALVPKGTEPPKAADAKGWLDLFVAAHASGRSHRELRAFIPVAWDLAQKITHGDIDRVDAYAGAQATVLIIRTLQQLSSL